MSEPKVQLLDPQGNINLPGINATGVITATSFDGAGGVVTGLTGNPNLNVGVVTATSFVGDGTGHAANLTGTPNLNLGLTTATSFVGDAVGKAAGLTGTPNLNVGLITATGFTGDVKGAVTGNITGNVTGNITGDVTGNITGNIGGDVEGDVTGNVSGLARGLGISANGVWAGAGTSNVNVGVITAIQYHGDGSGLTGAGSSAYIAQEITAIGAETIIDLSYGNLIYFDQNTPTTTVGFASTSAAEQITFIRDTSRTKASFTTGGVDFDGSGDYLTIGSSSDFSFGTGDFTIELWFRYDGTSLTSTNDTLIDTRNGDSGGNADHGWNVFVKTDGKLTMFTNGSDGYGYAVESNTVLSVGQWYHAAITRSGNTYRLFLNGVLDDTNTQSTSADAGSNFYIGYKANYAGSSLTYWNGLMSNLRILKGTALYTSAFNAPFYDLENITNTKLLCCQSDSSTTTAAVTPGTITANGDPTAGAQTISSLTSGFSISWPDRVKWNDATPPTLVTDNPRTSTNQLFHFTTVDTGLTYNAWEEIKTDSSAIEIWNWGRNSQGRLGLNQGYPALNALSSPVQLPGANWKALNGPYDGNAANMYATKTDGTLWSWGYGGCGALGLNQATGTVSSPIQVGTDTDWKQATAGKKYGNAVKTDGTLWSWGYAENGCFGNNTSGSSAQGHWRSSPTQVPGTNWTRVMAVKRTVSAFKTDGSLWFWGSESHGNFGQNNTTDFSSPVQVPGTWDPDAQFKAGKFAKKTDGTWWGWGSNTLGSLGINDGISRSSPVQLPGTWAQIDSGRSSLGVKTDGTLWTWGGNLNGNLGLNDQVQRSSPTQIGTGTDWSSNRGGVKAAQPNGCSACIKTDGSLWMWGKNQFGCIGQNQASPQVGAFSSPVQVPGVYTEIQGLNEEQYGVTSMRAV